MEETSRVLEFTLEFLIRRGPSSSVRRMESSYPPPQAPVPHSFPPQKSNLAIVSLVCGILGVVTCGLGGVAAVITGHMALSSIKRAGGMLTGQGLAIGGLIAGYLSVAIIAIAAVSGIAAPVILTQRHHAERKAKLAEVVDLWAALSAFHTKFHAFPSDALALSQPEFSGMSGPLVLQQLEAAGTISDLQAKLRVGKYAKGEWAYFTGVAAAGPSAPTPVPLLISPQIGVRCLVLYSNGAVKDQGDKEVAGFLVAPHVNLPTPRK